MTNIRATLSTALLLAFATVLLIGCGSENVAEQKRETAAPPVEALQALTGALPLEERLSGTVKARDQVEIRPEISARVVEVLVQSGAAVNVGQPLVRLDDETVRQQLRQAQASLRLAEAAAKGAHAEVAEMSARVSRSRSLAEQELIPELDLETQEAQLAAIEASAEQAEARVEEARATVEERRTGLERTVVRSPVTGRVGQRQVEVGMLVNASSLLFQVGNPNDLVVEIPLTERMLGYVEVGQTAVIRPEHQLDAKQANEPLRAELARISPFLAEGSFSTVGEIDVPPESAQRLRPGMFVRVDVLYGESEQATLVPASAVWTNPRTGLPGVFVVTGRTATGPAQASAQLSEEAEAVELRNIEVVAEGRAAVGLRGVEPNEWVVTIGQHLLSDEEVESARVRPVTWDKVMSLQGLQQEDLLREFLAKQRRLAKSLGAGLPPEDEYFKVAPELPAPVTESETKQAEL